MYEKYEARVLELEEYLDRFVLGANLAYDEKFHKEITERYTKIVKDVRMEICLQEDEKLVLVAMLSSMMETAQIEIQKK